ncbi:unnamed protein product [Arctia plantaginis]|uniref:Uncharacterized protein n=1 Tax=Arctia plantaginis TaxID=874455 RepID=A0A8S0Z7K9_ARCPL|nr:unnamed protein product [Arctia plantaginis]
MSQISENVRLMLVQLLPASIINDIKCFAFYDNHPRDEKNIDITICTGAGEVREYFQRDLVSSVNLQNEGVTTEIKLIRNKRCELFYLVAGGGELTILSRKEKLKIHERLIGVCNYKISDSACSGEAVLNVFLKYSEIPVVPDDNFKNFKPLEYSSSPSCPLLNEPIVTQLKIKLTEAKFTVKSNEQSLKEFLHLRQLICFSVYTKIHPKLGDSLFSDNLNEVGNALNIFTQKPWIKTCNNKIVIVHTVCNGNEEPLENVQILIHGTTGKSIEYTTKIFEKMSTPPFWKETQSQKLLCNVESALVVVVDLKELKDNIIRRIEWNEVIIYKNEEHECILPIDAVTLSSKDIMGEQFDVMCNDLSDINIILAVLATTEKTELILRHIKRSNEQNVTIDMFYKYLNMERVPNSDNIVVHRKSPYHALNGLMIILEGRNEETGQLAVAVYSRCPSQTLALVHYIQDAVPLRIITTTPNYKITSKSDTFSSYNENTAIVSEQGPNYMSYATSLLNRTSLVLDYLDNSMISMCESNDAVVLNKIGTEIDLFAQGEVGLHEFKKKMWDEARKGVEILAEKRVSVPVSGGMSVD